MADSRVDPLRRVREKITVTRAEANALLYAGFVQRVGGLLQLTSKGDALLKMANHQSW